MYGKFESLPLSEVDVNIKDFAKRLNLEIINMSANETMHISNFNINRPGLQLTGYYRHFSPQRVQVMGEMETAYIEGMSHEVRMQVLDKFFWHPIPCLIISSVLNPCSELLECARKYDRLILRSHLKTTTIINELGLYLNRLLAPTQTIHGVLMDIYGIGVLVIGDSGVGKSETALELVQRGHRLIADDAVTITCVGNDLEGTSPEVIRYLMEIRGVGIIDIRGLYGAGAVEIVKDIDIVVRLEDWDESKEYDRLGTNTPMYTILNQDRPLYIIPVKPGRNLAVILEACARTHRLKGFGYNALEELNGRLAKKKPD